MKVKDLIEALLELDPEKMVVVSGYEGGYQEISDIENISLVLNRYTEWYYGPHESVNKDGDCEAFVIS